MTRYEELKKQIDNIRKSNEYLDAQREDRNIWHREYQTKYLKTDKGKAMLKRYRHTDKFRDYQNTYNKEYRKRPEVAAKLKVLYKKYNARRKLKNEKKKESIIS